VQIRAESAERIIPLAVTTEVAFVAVHAVGEVGADDRAGGCGPVGDPNRPSPTFSWLGVLPVVSAGSGKGYCGIPARA
jgi:hypothetical protein